MAAGRNKVLLVGGATVALTLTGIGYMMQVRRRENAMKPTVSTNVVAV